MDYPDSKDEILDASVSIDIPSGHALTYQQPEKKRLLRSANE